MPCFLCKKFNALGKVIAVRFRKDRRTQNNLATTPHGGDGSVTAGIFGALPVPAVHPHSSSVQAVPARPESCLQVCTPGASDMEFKASGKVIPVRIRKNGQTRSNPATTSHDGDGSVTTGVFSAFKPLPALPPDSSLAQIVPACRESHLEVCTPGTSNISDLSLQVVAGSIPLVGPTIQAALDTLFIPIETIEIHHHYMGVIDGLTSRLSQLRQCLRNTPVARNGPEQYQRDEVASEMQSTSESWINDLYSSNRLLLDALRNSNNI